MSLVVAAIIYVGNMRDQQRRATAARAAAQHAAQVAARMPLLRYFTCDQGAPRTWRPTNTAGFGWVQIGSNSVRTGAKTG